PLNQTATVVGFQCLTITGAYTPNDQDNPTRLPDQGPPRHVILFELVSDNVLAVGDSGGVKSNLFATQPKLVQ
ncbi:MAG TPA: hypothetical protein VE082_01450, partial [Desulfobaccales bacterium]|nr:hypothetical protein [Desulfobaccales bacterium]